MNSTSILSDLGLGDLSSEDQAIIAEKMTEAILKRVVTEFMNELSPEDLEEFNDLSENASSEEVEDFFRSRVSDHDAKVEKVIEEFKLEMHASLNDVLS